MAGLAFALPGSIVVGIGNLELATLGLSLAVPSAGVNILLRRRVTARLRVS